MKQFDITFTISCGIIITAETEEEALNIYAEMSYEDLIRESDFVEDHIDEVQEIKIEEKN